MLDPDTGYFTHYPLGKQDKPTTLVAFTEHPAGVMWAVVKQQGLIKFDSNAQQVETIQTPSAPGALSRPTHIMKDSHNDLWITTTDGGLFRFNITTSQLESYSSKVSDASFRRANSFYMSMEDKAGNIWVATRDGLRVIDRKSTTVTKIELTNPDVKLDNVYSVFQDESGIIWAGTYSGVVFGTKSVFGKVDSGLNDNSVNAFAQTGDGRLWVGTNRGINSILTDTFSVENPRTYPWGASLLEPYIVMSLLGEGPVLWIGTLNSGLRRLNVNTGDIRTFRSIDGDVSSLGANGITSLLRTSDGLLLVGTYGGGLSIYNEASQNFERHTHESEDPSSIGSNVVLALTEDSHGDIWIGTDNGLSLFEPLTRTFSTFAADPDTLSSNMAWALHEDKKGTLWIGTQSGGLYAWDKSERAIRKETFAQYFDNVGLPSADIYAIRSDDSGAVWLSHNYGLSKLIPQSAKLQNFGLSDGLQAMDFNFASSYQDEAGRVYFGGSQGFNIVDPKTTLTDRYKPPLVITELRVSNNIKPLIRNDDGYERVVLDHNFQGATFSFSSLDYKNPAATKYRYRLDTYLNWTNNQNNNEISFGSLPSGKTDLFVQGSNSDGVWNEEGIRLEIWVKRDPWFSWWAYTIYMLAILAVLAILILRQSRKAQLAAERQHELELMVQARTDDMQKAIVAAEEANSAKSNFLATMSHEIRTPMHGMIGMTELLLNTSLNEQQKRFAKAAHNSGQALLALINDILDFSKIEASKIEVERIDFSLVELLDDIANIQSEPAVRRGLQLSSICDSSVPNRVKGDPTKIRQILMNLLPTR